jgi:transcriptional regulator with XRE-family HTH domain
MRVKLMPLARCRVPALGQFEAEIAADVRRCLATIQASGTAAIELAVILGVARSTLYRWRNGDDCPSAAQLAHLRAITSLVSGKRSAG